MPVKKSTTESGAKPKATRPAKSIVAAKPEAAKAVKHPAQAAAKPKADAKILAKKPGARSLTAEPVERLRALHAPVASSATAPQPSAALDEARAVDARLDLSDPAQQDSPLEVPHRYGDDRLVLMVRDPQWAYAYWDLSEGRLAQGIQDLQGMGHKGMLRVYDVSDLEFNGANAHGWRDQELHFDQGGCTLSLWESNRSYVAELGFLKEDGHFMPLLRSNAVHAPRTTPSPLVEEEWADFWGALKLWEASWGQGPLGLSSGSGGFEAWRQAASSPTSPFGAWGGSSERLASAWVQGLNAPSSFFAAPSGSWMIGAQGGSPSSPWGGATASAPEASAAQGHEGEVPPRNRKFFLWSKTELILYGGTEPDAALTVAGQAIALRPDGTFTLRFALPDGNLDLEVKATSADKIDTLGMTHTVRKDTLS